MASMAFQPAEHNSGIGKERGLDHGVFVPLLLIFPSAVVPTCQLSL